MRKDPKISDGFAYHAGSAECPVDPKSKVIILGWNGVTYQPRRASDIKWFWQGFGTDVFAFKPA